MQNLFIVSSVCLCIALSFALGHEFDQVRQVRQQEEANQQQQQTKGPNPLFDWLHLKGVDKLPWTEAIGKPLEDMFGAQTQQAASQVYSLFPQAKDAYEAALKQAELLTSQLDKLPKLDASSLPSKITANTKQ